MVFICVLGGQWRFSSAKSHLVQPYILCQNSCLSDNDIVPSNAFHTAHGVLGARILKWFAIPFSSGPHSVRSLHHDQPILGGPRAWLSFTGLELDKAVVCVIRLASFL